MLLDATMRLKKLKWRSDGKEEIYGNVSGCLCVGVVLSLSMVLNFFKEKFFFKFFFKFLQAFFPP